MTNTPYPKAAKMLDELEAIARARMADNGGEDYVYPKRSEHDMNCLYVHKGEGENGADVPGCIIGVWLHEYKHVPLEKLARKELVIASTVVEQVLLPGEFDEDLQHIADRVQTSQDKGYGWSGAVRTGQDILARRVELYNMDRARTFSG